MSRARNHRKRLRAADPQAYHAEALRRRTRRVLEAGRLLGLSQARMDAFVRHVGRRIALRMVGRGLAA